jgi:hypothetical protein
MTGRVLLVSFLVAACHCAPSPQHASMQQLQNRAAYDLACPVQWMRVHHLDGRTKGVEGCGNRVTYVEHCEATKDARCTWVLDMQMLQPVAATPSMPSTTTPSTSRPSEPAPLDPLLDRN